MKSYFSSFDCRVVLMIGHSFYLKLALRYFFATAGDISVFALQTLQACHFSGYKRVVERFHHLKSFVVFAKPKLAIAHLDDDTAAGNNSTALCSIQQLRKCAHIQYATRSAVSETIASS